MQKKHIILGLFYTLIFFGLHAQTETYIHRGSFTVANSVLVVDTNIYLAKCDVSSFSRQNPDNHVIYRLNRKLEILDSLDISGTLPADRKYGSFIANQATSRNDTLIFGFNSFDTTASYVLNPKIVITDINFSFVEVVEIDTTMLLTSFVFDKQPRRLWIAGGLWLSSDTLAPFLLKHDLQSNILSSKIISLAALNTTERRVFLSSLSIFQNQLFASIDPSLFVLEQLAVFDTALSQVQTYPVRDTALAIIGITQLIEAKNRMPKLISLVQRYIDTILVPPPGFDNFYTNIGLITMDSSYDVARIDTFRFTQNVVYDTIINFFNQLPFSTYATHPQNDTAIVGATNISVSSGNYYLQQPTWTYINLFNTHSGQSYWSKIYKNGYTFDIRRINYLPDNNWLLTFHEYNWDMFSGVSLAIHLVVIDENGLPLHINEDEALALTQHPEVFPNPATDYIQIQNLHWQGNQYEYALFDESGRIVLQGSVPEHERILLPAALNGVYVLAITNQTGFGWATQIIIRK